MSALLKDELRLHDTHDPAARTSDSLRSNRLLILREIRSQQLLLIRRPTTVPTHREDRPCGRYILSNHSPILRMNFVNGERRRLRGLHASLEMDLIG